MNKLRVRYYVSDINNKGGIQSFAMTTAAGLENMCDIELLDWRSVISFPQKVLVYIAPSFIGAKLYQHWLQRSIAVSDLRNNCDIVHFWHIKAAMSAVNNIRIPYVVCCHGSEIMKSRIAKYQYDLFLKSLRKAAIIVSNSDFTRDYIISNYGINPRKIVVIHPGIDTTKFSPHSVNRVQKDMKIIGTLTRLVERKNIPHIIEALNILYDRGVSFKYILAGVGSSRVTKRIIKKLKASKFEWEYLGGISEEKKIIEFYPALDLFLLPALYIEGDVEGFGIVFLEANASRIPVVASKTGGITDAVKDKVSGLFADPNKPEDIADKVYTILSSKKDWQNSSYKWAQNFNKEKSAAQFRAVYEKVMEVL